MKYCDITVRCLGFIEEAAHLKIGESFAMIRRDQMSYASWYILKDTVPNTPVLIKIREGVFT